MHQGGHGLRRLPRHAAGGPGRRTGRGGHREAARTVRALHPHPGGDLREDPHRAHPQLQRTAGDLRRGRRRLRRLQAGRRQRARHPRPRPGHRAHPGGRAGRPAGLQRPLPRQPPEGRHLLGDPARRGRRDHGRAGHRAGRGGPGLWPLHEDHRRAADRPLRGPQGAAARHLAAARRRRVRVRTGLREVPARGEVLRGSPLLPLRAGRLDPARDRPGAALPGSAHPAQVQGRGLRLPARVRGGEGKDIGVIATANGWNLYVSGNGGATRATRTCWPPT